MSQELEVKKPEPPSMAWLLTFADLVSLLITFFVLLYSMKEVNEDRWAEVMGSMQGSFNIQKVVMKEKADQQQTVSKVSVVKGDNLPYLKSILETRFSQEDSLRGVKVTYHEAYDQLTISLPSSLLFEIGGTSLTEKGVKAVESLAENLRHIDNKLEVSGHTDPQPINGGEYPTNWELAMDRSIEVANGLKALGVGENVPAVSYGQSRYKANPDMPESINFRNARRVDIVVFGEGGPDV